jgi:hypothetical protein
MRLIVFFLALLGYLNTRTASANVKNFGVVFFEDVKLKGFS